MHRNLALKWWKSRGVKLSSTEINARLKIIRTITELCLKWQGIKLPSIFPTNSSSFPLQIPTEPPSPELCHPLATFPVSLGWLQDEQGCSGGEHLGFALSSVNEEQRGKKPFLVAASERPKKPHRAGLKCVPIPWIYSSTASSWESTGNICGQLPQQHRLEPRTPRGQGSIKHQPNPPWSFTCSTQASDCHEDSDRHTL